MGKFEKLLSSQNEYWFRNALKTNLLNLNNLINHGLDNGTAGTGSELVS